MQQLKRDWGTLSDMLYLDYAASTPLRTVAKEALFAFYAEPYAQANPHSLHSLGRLCAGALEEARKEITHATQGAFSPSELTFTGGGTEAINLAILGMAEGIRNANGARGVVFMSALEHDAVFDLQRPLRARGFEVCIIPATRDGMVDLDYLATHVDKTTALVCCMGANNETGCIQPLEQVGQIAHAAGAYLFSDCVQAFMKTPLPFTSLDGFAFAGHKLGAPTGTGAMLIKRSVPYIVQAFGGAQEKKRRPGTQNVAASVALGKTVSYLEEHRAKFYEALLAKTRLVEEILFASDTSIVSSLPLPSALLTEGRRLAGIVSVLLPHIDSDIAILGLDALGFEVSAASACTSQTAGGSRILQAMGLDKDLSESSLRISFDERIEDADLIRFSTSLIDLVKTLPKKDA